MKTIRHYLEDICLDLKITLDSELSSPELTRCVERAVADLSRFEPRRCMTKYIVDSEVTSESFTTPAAASDTAIVNAASIATSVDGDTLTIADNFPDVPRPVKLTVTDANEGITELVVVVKGYDRDGRYQEEFFTIGAGLVQSGSKYFSAITEVEVDKVSGNSTGDTISIGTTANPWVWLSNKPIDFESESITDYTRYTDYEVDYDGGRIRLKTGGSMAASTAYTIAEYTKSLIYIDISDIKDLISIERVEYPAGEIPRAMATYEVWGDLLEITGTGVEQQSKMEDEHHVSVYYYAKHEPPNVSSRGTYPAHLDTTVELAAGAYAMMIRALQYEAAAITDLASMRTELGLTTAVHTSIGTALTSVKTYLDNNSAADAAGILQDITDDVANLRTAIETALTAIGTALGKVESVDLDKATTGGEAYLDAADDLINALNDGGPDVPEKYALLTQMRNAMANTRIQQSTMYAQEVVQRLSNLTTYIQQSAGYSNISSVFAREAEARLAEMNGYLQEAAQYKTAADTNLYLADRLKQEAIERRNEAWAIWSNPLQIGAQYPMTHRRQ